MSTALQPAIDPARRVPWQAILGAGIVLGSLVALAMAVRGNWSQLAEYRWTIDPWLILAALPVYALALGLAVALWRAILRSLGGRSTWRDDLCIYCASSLARRLPTPAWFVASRLAMYGQRQTGRAAVSAGMVIEMALIIIAGALMALLAAPVGLAAALGEARGYLLLTVVAAGAVLVLVPSAVPRLVLAVARLLRRAPSLSTTLPRWSVMVWLLGYAAIWALGGGVLYLLVRALHPITPDQLPQMVGAWALAGTAANVALITPGGLGVKELALAALLAQVLPLPVALSVAIGSRIWYALAELLALAVATIIARRRAP